MAYREIGVTLKASVTTVLKTLESTKHKIKPKQSHYDCLETDEFWTYAGEKKNKIWLVYAYHRESGEIAASNRRFAVWGKRDLKTAQKLGKRIKGLGIRYDRIAADDWGGFLSAFREDSHEEGKDHTVGIEGNNCRLAVCCASRIKPPKIA